MKTSEIELKGLYFYQNNPCIVQKLVSENLVEVTLSLGFQPNLDAVDFVTPPECYSPKSNNEDRMAWEEEVAEEIIRQVSEDEHSILMIVECRLLSKYLVEHVKIDSLQKVIQAKQSEINDFKSLEKEWREHFALLTSRHEAIVESIAASNEQKKILNQELEAMENRVNDELRLKEIKVISRGVLGHGISARALAGKDKLINSLKSELADLKSKLGEM